MGGSFLSLRSVLISGIDLSGVGLFGNRCGPVNVGFLYFLFLPGVFLWVSDGSFVLGVDTRCYFRSKKEGLFEIHQKADVPKREGAFHI